MSRHARQRSESGVYHIMLRGINRQRVFDDDGDYRKFIECLSVAKERSGIAVFAYVLMSNHVHLLVAEGQEPISVTMKRLAVRYAGWFNWKNDRVGHLFQDRFASRAVEDDAYFLTVLSYIHFNPVKEGICSRPQDYPWSSRSTWGRGSSLVDLSRLQRIVSITAVRTREISGQLADQSTSVLEYEERRRLTDDDAWSLVTATSGARTVTAFQRLSLDDQRRTLSVLCDHQVPVFQASRITGINRKTIARWNQLRTAVT